MNIKKLHRPRIVYYLITNKKLHRPRIARDEFIRILKEYTRLYTIEIISYAVMGIIFIVVCGKNCIVPGFLQVAPQETEIESYKIGSFHHDLHNVNFDMIEF